MISTMPAPLNVEQRAAIRRIAAFRQRFGERHFYLACHAALPMALTPDLLYCLWVNFQRDNHQELLDIPWIAVSDLILSNLCEEVGYEIYEMDTSIRNELLQLLQHDSRFGLERIRELADFVMAHVEQQIDSPDLDTRDFAEAQKWRALAYKNSTEAAHEIALALANLNLEHKTEWIRMAALLETITKPLFKFQPLLDYASAMAEFNRGNVEAATVKFNGILNSTNKIQVAGVNLYIPKVIKENHSQPYSSALRSKTLRRKFFQDYAPWLATGSVALVLSIVYFLQLNQSPRTIPRIAQSPADSQPFTSVATPSPKQVEKTLPTGITPPSTVIKAPSQLPISTVGQSAPQTEQTITSPSTSTIRTVPSQPQKSISPTSKTTVPPSQPRQNIGSPLKLNTALLLPERHPLYKTSLVTSVTQLTDVSPTDWYFQALQSLVERYGVIYPNTDYTFRGNQALTRAEFVDTLSHVLAQMYELSKGTCEDSPPEFASISSASDVSPTDWFYTSYKAITAFTDSKLGFPDNTFRGNQPITRAEMAASLNVFLDSFSEYLARSRYPNLHSQNAPLFSEGTLAQATSISQFSDVKPTDWFFQALQSLVERYGVVVGSPQGGFQPNRAATRAEFVAMLNASLDRLNGSIAYSECSNRKK